MFMALQLLFPMRASEKLNSPPQWPHVQRNFIALNLELRFIRFLPTSILSAVWYRCRLQCAWFSIARQSTNGKMAYTSAWKSIAYCSKEKARFSWKTMFAIMRLTEVMKSNNFSPLGLHFLLPQQICSHSCVSLTVEVLTAFTDTTSHTLLNWTQDFASRAASRKEAALKCCKLIWLVFLFLNIKVVLYGEKLLLTE